MVLQIIVNLLDTITKIIFPISFNKLLILANLGFITFYFLQWKDSKRAILYTKYVGRDKDEAKQKVLEKNPLYFYVNNKSDKAAIRLKVNKEFRFDNKVVKLDSTSVSVLNPNEGLKILVRDGELIKKYPDLFEEKKVKYKRGTSKTYKIPKKTLKIELRIKIRWGLFYKQVDSYELEWGSLESYPHLKDHPIVLSWNKRDGEYIYKLND